MDPLPEPVAEALRGTPVRVGLACRRLADGHGFAHDGDGVYTQASAIKVPILWELHRAADRGELSLDETLSPGDCPPVGGCGVLRMLASPATRIALADVGVLMVVLSDNVATNLLIDRVGIDRVNDLLTGLGLTQTRLRRRMMDYESRAKGIENTATPAEAVRLLAALADAERSGESAAARTLAVMRQPKESPLQHELLALSPPPTVANKPGFLDGLRTEWALVTGRGAPWDYAAAIMLAGAPTGREGEELLQRLVRDLTRAIDQAMVGP